LRARHLQLSSEALEEVFNAWRKQMTDMLGRQDIQAARLLIEKFISKIELGYNQVRIWYRYPLEVGLGGQNGRGKKPRGGTNRALVARYGSQEHRIHL
jgi:hypothetical protein